ncbi:hypothetical protein LCGC14_1442540 [marine sediment metagenome]|uniref:Uncharacterized protein n=1 Tax=marine sediment metagenome TaxID=412755 RepID=A0A0F9M0S4_9ZZZZ
MSIEEFTTTYENVTFSVAEDRKTASIKLGGLPMEIKLSSGSMYVLCKGIVDLIETETVAFDYFEREMLIE